MSRRGRAVAFLLLALLAAAAAAAIADGYGSSVTRGYGPLRPVVVTSGELPAGKPIGPAEIASQLEVRRVPERFIPPSALIAPTEALGLVAVAPQPAGAYLLGSQLRPPGRRGGSRRRLGGNRGPVEITVSGADALLGADPGPRPRRVDVVVTSEPGSGGVGRTYVAAARVPLLALRPAEDEIGVGGAAAATLGLTRRQALKLIAAESFARKITLLAGG
jgi:Flp pilus assembly protein CpaB